MFKEYLSHQGSLRAPKRDKIVGTLCFLKLFTELKLSTFLRSPANIYDKEASRNVYNTALNSFPSSVGSNLKCTTNEELKSFGNVCKRFTFIESTATLLAHKIFFLLTFFMWKLSWVTAQKADSPAWTPRPQTLFKGKITRAHTHAHKTQDKTN